MSASSVLPVRSCDTVPTKGVAVIAAGAVPWRRGKNGIQVLLIHRPKYGDWSFPKGKLDADESVAECAVREVREEVGLRITLGLPLPAVRYDVSKGPKIVYYWAAKVTGEAVPDGGEVDKARWMDGKSALGKLSNAADRAPLQALLDAAGRGELATVPFLLARHSKARPRAGWTRAEGERPLASSGMRQSRALAGLLEAWDPVRLVSSPWTRCVQTLMPFAAATGRSLKTAPALTEHAAAKHPGRAAKTFTKQLLKPRATLLCTHRPVLPTLLPVLAEHVGGASGKAERAVRGVLPSKDPYLRPGAVIVAQRAVDDPSRIVSLEIHEPFDD